MKGYFLIETVLSLMIMSLVFTAGTRALQLLNKSVVNLQTHYEDFTRAQNHLHAPPLNPTSTVTNISFTPPGSNTTFQKVGVKIGNSYTLYTLFPNE